MPRNSDRVDPGSSQLNLTPSSPEFRRASFVSPEGEAQTFEGGRDRFCRRIYAASTSGLYQVPNCTHLETLSLDKQCSRASPIPSPLKSTSLLAKPQQSPFPVAMPDIAQILRDSVSKGNNSTDKAIKGAAPPPPPPVPAVPQEIPATKPSGIERLFNAIPHPKFGSPVEKCSGFADYPAEEYHTSLNSVAFFFAKSLLESFEHIHDEDYQAYLVRVEDAVKEMYPLLVPVLEVLYEAAHCARDHTVEILVRSELGMLYAYEDDLVAHVEGVSHRKWEPKDFIDGEDLNTRFVQRVLRSLRKIIDRRRKESGDQQESRPTIQEDVQMVSATA